MKETSMSSERKVAVITGASQGIGAALVEAYRDRDYGVVATARSIKPTNDDQILVVPGDITDRKTAERAISEGLRPVREAIKHAAQSTGQGGLIEVRQRLPTPVGHGHQRTACPDATLLRLLLPHLPRHCCRQPRLPKPERRPIP
jgi:hypothetical protein